MKKLLVIINGLLRKKTRQDCIDLAKVFPAGLTPLNAQSGLWFYFKASSFVKPLSQPEPSGGTFYGEVIKVSKKAMLVLFYQELGSVYYAWVRVLENGAEPKCFLDRKCRMAVPFPRDIIRDIEAAGETKKHKTP